ncbi:hypothetical protein NPIL_46251 [Nephila pilipes]|uniref:Uncharacterized protein n=1 Tax=Nephila pilipes TaxID=299642 RepID=A0A8X6PT86_NEPPI|nr:hypothetical protein NPIL_46251 [Nephila pilipes]
MNSRSVYHLCLLLFHFAFGSNGAESVTALHWAAKHGDANVIKLIAGAYKVNPNIRSGYTPVHLAALYKHDMIIHLLVHTYGADPSIRDYSGKRADQYPDNYVRVVAGHKTTERRPLKPISPAIRCPAEVDLCQGRWVRGDPGGKLAPLRDSTHPTPLVNDQTSCRWDAATTWNDLDIWNGED